MTQHDQSQDADLDRLLAAARQTEEGPPDDLMRRVLADAAALQLSPSAKMARRTGRWRVDKLRLPRLGAFGGLVTASVLGFWMGVYPPPVLDEFEVSSGFRAQAPLNEDAAEVSGFGWDLEES